MRQCVSISALAIFLVVFCTACTAETEWVIPDDFVTYDDPDGLYSISYPSDWKVNLALIEQLEGFMKDYIADIEEGIPVEQATFLFMAGIPHAEGYHPNVGIVIEPLPVGVVGVRTLLRAELNGITAVAQDFQEISRDKVKAGGRDAYILEYKATFPNLGSSHALVLFTIAGDNAWTMTCTSLEGIDDFDQHVDDFQSIVRSLRIHE
jgi:hypothetical protein